MLGKTEIEPVARMQAIVTNWLATEDWTTGQLIDWLQGYDLPLFGDADESYLWLLRGIPDGDKRHPIETRFAERVAALINERPDVKRPGKRPDQILDNLFMLCAALSCADELADPLFGVLQRGQLRGEWRGNDLRTSLKAALIANQKDSRLLPFWEGALQNSEQRFLTIDEFDFVEAARLMPPSASERGKPAMDAIGRALRLTASRWQEDAEKRLKHRALICKVEDTYPSRPSWPLDLVYAADTHEWPKWAVDCLPSLHIRLETNTSITWHYLAACIPYSLEYDVIKKLCGDQVYELRMAEGTIAFLEKNAPTFERNRLGNPYPSDSSVLGVVITSIIENGLDPKSAPIGDVLKRLGGYAKADLDHVIEPIADRVSEGKISEDNVVQFARASDLPAQTVSYIEMRIAA